MTVHLDASDLWQAADEDYEVAPLPANPTVAQMKLHKEKTLRKSKAKACMFSAVSSSIFTKIMRLKTANDIWDYLKKEYQGNERTRNMQILNLIREFEMMKMKEAKTIKEYSNTLLGIANKIRLLDKDFPDDQIMQKILLTLPEKRMLRNEEPLEGAFQAKAKGSRGGQDKKNFKKKKVGNDNKNETHPLGCTDHITNDRELFKELDKTNVSKVKIGNGVFLPIKGKGTVAIQSLIGVKYISNVLYVPDIDQNLLNVGQLIEKRLQSSF
nr:Retrovirus-related Pol polyprotein from transposon TNT 1-94 [Ipomoea batatas]